MRCRRRLRVWSAGTRASPSPAAITSANSASGSGAPGGGELRLFRRGDDHMIMLGGNELMSSRMSGSEEALAVLQSNPWPGNVRQLTLSMLCIHIGGVAEVVVAADDV